MIQSVLYKRRGQQKSVHLTHKIWTYRPTSMLDTDTRDIGLPIACVPHSITIPYELSSNAIRLHLIMGRCFAYDCVKYFV